MRVFVTGASGFIGSAVVADLLRGGHHVVGLARSDAAARALSAAGAAVHRGSIEEVEALRVGAANSDGVIHLAFNHDFSQYDAAQRTDAAAVAMLGGALAGSNRPLVIAAGLLTAGLSETDALPEGSPRAASEREILQLAERGVRSAIVRLPPAVHGKGDTHGFTPRLIALARDKGVAAYVEDGVNRWAAVHRLDAARLFRLALERAAAGTRLHAVADEGVRTREIAAAIGRRLGVPVVSKSRDEAAAHFGFLGALFSIDAPASSALTRQRFGWDPVELGLLADIDGDSYVGRLHRGESSATASKEI